MDVYREKEQLLEDISVESLKVRNKIKTYDSVIAESGRIERIAEGFFLRSPEKEYNMFMIDWLKENLNDILYSDKYYYDVTVPDTGYENSLDNYLRKS